MHRKIVFQALRSFLQVAVIASLGPFALGCGSSPPLTFSCDNTSGGVHVCNDYSVTNGTMDDLTQYRTACAAQGGVSVAICSHTGSVGGCTQTATANGVTIAATQWTYTGTAAALMSGCQQLGGSYVSP